MSWSAPAVCSASQESTFWKRRFKGGYAKSRRKRFPAATTTSGKEPAEPGSVMRRRSQPSRGFAGQWKTISIVITDVGMRSYLDSDVLIGHLRGDRRARALLERLSSGGHADLWIGALQRIEIVFFMHPDETDDTEAFLQRFHTDSLTEEIVDYAGVLYRQ